jgi:hypothetical protein
MRSHYIVIVQACDKFNIEPVDGCLLGCSAVHHQGDEISLMMEAARTSETLVNFYQTARRYNPEDSHLRTHRRENLKSYIEPVVCMGVKRGLSN